MQWGVGLKCPTLVVWGYNMFRVLALCFCSLVLCLDTARAQTPAPASSEAKDEVVVTGTVKGRDKAMGAFFSGDYETAEIEFENNLKQIRIRRARFEDAVTRIASAEINAEMAQASGTGVGGGSGLSDFNADAINGIVDISRAKDRRKKDANLKGLTSGEDESFQLYMIGMSELQQGKMEEAKSSLRRSLRMNGRNYDARYRLALIHILDKDYTAANIQYSKLQKRLKVCQKRRRNLCAELTEVEDAIAVLNSVLSKRS